MAQKITRTLSKKRTQKKTKKPPIPVAVHAEHVDGVHHIVGLGNIRVILMQEEDGSAWFAQGLEIDYGVQGDSVEGAKKEFEEGLSATVQEHLRVFGNIDNLLQVAPNEIWNLATSPHIRLRVYSQVTGHHILKGKSNYDGIDYLVAAQAAGSCQ
jgi:hypothetical protein